jgi:hypothetical protein
MQDLEKEIIDALGLKGVIKLDLHLEYGKPITIDVLAYPDGNGLKLLAPIFKKYKVKFEEMQEKENK